LSVFRGGFTRDAAIVSAFSAERAVAVIVITPDPLPVGDTFAGAFGVANLPDFGNFEAVQVEARFASTADRLNLRPVAAR
jgi:predicted secreted protein